MIIYQKLWSLERALDRAGVLRLFPPRSHTWGLTGKDMQLYHYCQLYSNLSFTL